MTRDGSRDSRPRASVVVPTFRGQDVIFQCLESLARQDLPFDEYEVVVVLNGPADATAARIDEARRVWPDLRLRVLRSSASGAGRARNLGLASAAGDSITFLDDDDRVSPEYLRVLLSVSEAGIVPLAQLADVHGENEPSYENYIGEQFLPLAGQVVPLAGHSRALGFNACKLLPAAIAKSVLFEEDLRSGEDLVYWFDIACRLRFRLAVTNVEATYFRSHRTGTVSRQDASFDFSVSQRLDVIERLSLRDVPAHAVDAPALRSAFIAGQTAHIASYLRQRPEERSNVLAEIDRRGLAHQVDWRELNRGMARELAVLYAFMPYADTSAFVAARRIRLRGEHVDVVSNNLGNTRPKDESGWRIATRFVGRHHQVSSPATALNWKGLTHYCEGGIAKIEEWVALQGPYSSVYSRAMLPGSHLLAALVKLRYPETLWRAEFSDPIVWNAYGERRAEPADDDDLWKTFAMALTHAGVAPPTVPDVAMAVELLAYALADEVVFTNEHQMEFMLGYLEDRELAQRVRGRARWEHHPVPPPDLYQDVPAHYPMPEGRKNIAYFGAFYATRGLTEVVEALRSLDVDHRDRLAFHVFTPNPAALREEMEALDLTDVVRVNGHVPYLECLNLATQMDVLLVNDARTRQHYPLNPFLPSKWSDYRGSGADVWAIVEEGSVLDSMDVRHKSYLGDVGGARAVLASIARMGAEPVRSSRPTPSGS